VIILFTGVLSSSSYLNGFATAVRFILYFLMSVPELFLRLIENDPSFIEDLRFISNIIF